MGSEMGLALQFVAPQSVDMNAKKIQYKTTMKTSGMQVHENSVELMEMYVSWERQKL